MRLLADSLDEEDVVVVDEDVTALTTWTEEIDLTRLVVVLHAEDLERNSICFNKRESGTGQDKNSKKPIHMNRVPHPQFVSYYTGYQKPS